MLCGDIDDLKLVVVLCIFELIVKQKFDGVLYGDYFGLIFGLGLELGELCFYQFGDDVCWMDWVVIVCIIYLYVWQMIVDWELEIWLVVDMLVSLDFGIVCCEKCDFVVVVVVVIIFFNSGGGNWFGVLIVNGVVMIWVLVCIGC